VRESLKAKAKGMVAVLKEMRETLMRGENPSQELKERYHTLHKEEMRLQATYKEEMARLASEVEGVLEPHQLYALESYVPCIIPPEGEPRIGQAQGAKGAVLERLRAIPNDQFALHKEDIARQALERLKERYHGVLILDEEKELARILGLIEKVRALSDVEFKLQREALIEELLAPYEAAHPPVELTAMISSHLLDPAIIPLLEEKLRQAGE